MAWLNQFKLGRPGSEYAFTLNPEGIDIDEGPVDSIYRNLAGDAKRSVLKTSAPNIRISSSYLLKAERDILASMPGITDTHLSFQCRDDFQVILEGDIPTTTGSVYIQNTSATRLSAALVAAGSSPSIAIVGVYDNAAGTGTNYYSGGSYDSATRLVTLGSVLPSITVPCYVTYTYTGWLVVMKRLPHKYQGGWVDRATYDFELVGA